MSHNTKDREAVMKNYYKNNFLSINLLIFPAVKGIMTNYSIVSSQIVLVVVVKVG